MFLPFELLSENLNMDFMLALYLIFMLGGFIFYVRSVEIGSILHTLISILFFIWEYLRNVKTGEGNWAIPLICALLFFIVWCLTLYSVVISKRTIEG